MKAKKRGAARGAVARLQATRALPLECRLERKAWRRARDKAVRGGLPAPAVVRGSALGDGEAAVFLSSALPGDPQAGAELLEGAAESFWRRSWQGDLRDDVQGNVQSDVKGDVKSDLQRSTNYLAQGAHQGHDFRWLLDLRTLGGTGSTPKSRCPSAGVAGVTNDSAACLAARSGGGAFGKLESGVEFFCHPPPTAAFAVAWQSRRLAKRCGSPT